MHRTQIYLDDEIYNFLKKESKIHQTAISEIIRGIIRNNIKNQTATLIQRMEKIAGIWKNKRFNVEKYIRDLRQNRTI